MYFSLPFASEENLWISPSMHNTLTLEPPESLPSLGGEGMKTEGEQGKSGEFVCVSERGVGSHDTLTDRLWQTPQRPAAHH